MNYFKRQQIGLLPGKRELALIFYSKFFWNAQSWIWPNAFRKEDINLAKKMKWMRPVPNQWMNRRKRRNERPKYILSMKWHSY
jgi:hypothetical protein